VLRGDVGLRNCRYIGNFAGAITAVATAFSPLPHRAMTANNTVQPALLRRRLGVKPLLSSETKSLSGRGQIRSKEAITSKIYYPY
jgi:hypothetical protein